MKPGLTHRKWGQHFNRHQTWWPFSQPYFDYVTRCQYLLQQGRRVVDVACLYHEGAPLNFNDIKFDLPPGYDYDFCTPDIIKRMEVKGGRIHLPTGVSYRYLVLPKSGRLTLATMRSIEKLRDAGASIYLQSRMVGTPGLEGYPEADQRIREMAKAWPVLPQGGWQELLASDKLASDFEGEGLQWIHRRTTDADLFFIANTTPESVRRECTFRIAGRIPELWNPETGEVFTLPGVRQTDGRTSVVLQFDPAQSWFVVFRHTPSQGVSADNPFAQWETVRDITGPWMLNFDPDWGTKDRVTLEALGSWSEQVDPLVKYYSGTAIYSKVFDVSRSDRLTGQSRCCLDLGQVEVMARVTLNGKVCGITWKPPYRVDITEALNSGQNRLEIEVVNTWVNRMIGDEQLPLDAAWKDWETLVTWPDWFKQGDPSPTGRYTFTTARHYTKTSPLMPSGLLGPVRILRRK
jgi:hypothetical protein